MDFEPYENGALKFVNTTSRVEAGHVTINLVNITNVRHDVAIEDSDGKTVAKTAAVANDVAVVDVNLESGTYTFYCSLPGHREAGMEGTLIVYR